VTVEATLTLKIDEAAKVDARPSTPTSTRSTVTTATPAPLCTPEAPTDAQIKGAHGHNVEELVKEMHGERAGWESHPVRASSPLWAGKLLANVHGSTIARLIASMGNDPYLAYNRDAWTALDHLLKGNNEAAHEIMSKDAELSKKIGKLLRQLGTNPKTVAAVLLRGHAAARSAKPQTTAKAPLQMLMDHVKEHDRPLARLNDTPHSARRVVLRSSTAAPRTGKPAVHTPGRVSTGLSAMPSPVKAYLIAQRAAYVALAHARLAKDKVSEYRTPKQRRLIKKVKRKSDAHARTRRDGSELELEQQH